MKNRNKMLSLLALLAVLAVLEPITGNPQWRVFLSFLAFLAFTSIKADERFRTNCDKAARNGFISLLLCITALVFYLTVKPAFEHLVLAVQAILVIGSLTFAASYTYYDKKGT